jgi:hypothetical protein
MPGPLSQTAQLTPGGISLSKAAAARMPLNIALDGAYYKDGRLVLSGRSDRESGFNAALLLTALRAACEPTDPYFSLDPVDVVAWNADGQSASEDLWRHITKDLNWGTKAMAKPSNTTSLLILLQFGRDVIIRACGTKYRKAIPISKPNWSFVRNGSDKQGSVRYYTRETFS